MSVCECLCASDCLWLCALLLLLGLWALLLGLWFLWLWLGLVGACGRPCWASKCFCWAAGAFARLSTCGWALLLACSCWACGRFCWDCGAGLGLWVCGAHVRPHAPTCTRVSPFFPRFFCCRAVFRHTSAQVATSAHTQGYALLWARHKPSKSAHKPKRAPKPQKRPQAHPQRLQKPKRPQNPKRPQAPKSYKPGKSAHKPFSLLLSL